MTDKDDQPVRHVITLKEQCILLAGCTGAGLLLGLVAEGVGNEAGGTVLGTATGIAIGLFAIIAPLFGDDSGP